MINGEDDMEIMNGQNPFFLVFEPLRFLESPTLGTVSILSSLVVKLPTLTFRTSLQHSTHSGRAAIEYCAHGFMLLIRKPMRLFIFANMFAEDVSHIVFPLWLLRCCILYMSPIVVRGSSNGWRYLRWGGDGEAVQPEK